MIMWIPLAWLRDPDEVGPGSQMIHLKIHVAGIFKLIEIMPGSQAPHGRSPGGCLYVSSWTFFNLSQPNRENVGFRIVALPIFRP